MGNAHPRIVLTTLRRFQHTLVLTPVAGKFRTTVLMQRVDVKQTLHRALLIMHLSGLVAIQTRSRRHILRSDPGDTF